MGKIAWKIMGGIAAVVATLVADQALDAGWRAVTGAQPPTIPEDPDSSWREAIAWAALSGAVIGLARLVATRKAAQFYKKSAGELPAELQG